eukprot:TRINITY_DN9157_c0_g2_i3.p1 TRINITY_DN9157_c0_g2~~TRINITY_DN9157_c0_g2_i3.p1  ORF type:complete len:297 (-),score=37.53 TRINITY_DN9157_c0_g2_i3:62-952(-)
MGIEGSTENSSKPKVEFRFLRNETHRRYGQVKLYVQDKTNRVFIASEHVANEKIALKKTLEFAEFRVVQNHPAIQRMGGFMKLQNDAACGGYFKVSLLFEYIDYDLLDEIEKRKPSLNLVDEPELARILATVIDAGLHYQKTNQTHGNISPVNILIGEMKQFKLRDPELCGGTQLENMLRGADPTVGCYLSPQQMEAWKLNKPAGYNQLKSDVFALGMTMLHVASLQDVPRLCYDIPKRLINFSRVNEILDSIEHKYSQPFVFVLRKMLNSDEVSRPDFLLLRELAKDLRLSLIHI